MWSYAASLLRVLQQPFAGTQPRDIGSSDAGVQRTPTREVICRPDTIYPDPAIRLRISNESHESDEIIRIFGFPPAEGFTDAMPRAESISDWGSRGPPVLFLDSDIPAYIHYIMGNDWRSKVRSDYHHAQPLHRKHGNEVILRPAAVITNGTQNRSPTGDSLTGDDLAEERAHSLRMRRCGAIEIRSEMDVASFDRSIIPEHLFGWPSTGGVWVFRKWKYPHKEFREMYRYRTGDGQRIKMGYESMATREQQAAVYEDLKLQQSMEGVCDVLDKAGAQFYSDMKDCPEVVEYGMVE
ncbi:hypothetical protein Q7P37_008560 [Cladosporium fusiforme]